MQNNKYLVSSYLYTENISKYFENTSFIIQ